MKMRAVRYKAGVSKDDTEFDEVLAMMLLGAVKVQERDISAEKFLEPMILLDDEPQFMR